MHKTTVRSPEGIRHCDGCGGEHLGLRCEPGTKYVDRLRSTQLDGSVTPTQNKRNYYSDDGLTEVFGLNAKERKEQMMEQTGGHGFFDRDRPMTAAAAKHFFGDAD